MKDGWQLCEDLLLNFDAVYERTNTSYKPLQHRGVWYSDYKSSSSVERIEAFIKLGRPDPVAYADETGPVKWEVAKAHAEKVLKDKKSFEDLTETYKYQLNQLIFFHPHHN